MKKYKDMTPYERKKFMKRKEELEQFYSIKRVLRIDV
jgi:hypothetical protein